jgi:antitoxin MazE
MLTTIRKMGNSQGVIIPKPLLQQVGLADKAEMVVEGDALILRKPKAHPRAGWDEAGKKLLAMGDATPVLLDFPNEGDDELVW